MTSSTTSDADEKPMDFICVKSATYHRLESELNRLQASHAKLTHTMTATSHDLRQHLHFILASIESLNRTSAPARTVQLGARMRTMVHRLAGGLEQLILQAGSESSDVLASKAGFALSSALSEVHNQWMTEAAGKKLAFAVAQTDTVVYSDQRLMLVILNNLVGNAIRYTAKGAVRIDAHPDGTDIAITVRDTGPGMHANRSTVRARAAGQLTQGLGLGLQIATSTALLLGHPLEFSSSPSGTSVTLRVPTYRIGERAAPPGDPRPRP